MAMDLKSVRTLYYERYPTLSQVEEAGYQQLVMWTSWLQPPTTDQEARILAAIDARWKRVVQGEN